MVPGAAVSVDALPSAALPARPSPSAGSRGGAALGWGERGRRRAPVSGGQAGAPTRAVRSLSATREARSGADIPLLLCRAVPLRGRPGSVCVALPFHVPLSLHPQWNWSCAGARRRSAPPRCGPSASPGLAAGWAPPRAPAAQRELAGRPARGAPEGRVCGGCSPALAGFPQRPPHLGLSPASLLPSFPTAGQRAE